MLQGDPVAPYRHRSQLGIGTAAIIVSKGLMQIGVQSQQHCRILW